MTGCNGQWQQQQQMRYYPLWDNLLAKEQASHIPCSLVLAHKGKDGGKDGAAEGGSTYVVTRESRKTI